MATNETERELIDVAASLEYAASAFKQGRFADAEPVYKHALTVLEREYGAGDPDTVACLQSLGDIYYQLGRYKEALPLYKRLLAIGEKVLGTNHPSVVDMVLRLASTYQQLGLNDDAETLFRRANKMSKSSLAALNRPLPDVQSKPDTSKKRVVASPSSLPNRPNARTNNEIFSERLDLQEIKKGYKGNAAGGKKTELVNLIEAAWNQIRTHSGAIISAVVLIALIVLACIMFSKLNLAPIQGAQLNHLKNSSYKTADGFLDLIIKPNGEPVYKQGGIPIAATVTAMGPDLIDFKDSIISSLINKEVWFEEIPVGLRREDGTVLYSKNSPEMKVIRQLDEVKKNANSWFLQLRKYPTERGEVVLSLNPENAVTGRPERPSIDKVDNNTEDLREVTDLPVVTQPLDEIFESEGTAHWLKESAGYPGAIRCLSVVHHLPKGDIREFFAHGYDRNGNLIMGGKPRTVYLVAFRNGNTPVREIPKLKLGRPLKICIVKNPNSNTPLWVIHFFTPLFCAAFALLFYMGGKLGQAKGQSTWGLPVATRVALGFAFIASLWLISSLIP